MTDQNHLLGLLNRYLPERREISLLEMVANGERLATPMRRRAADDGSLLNFARPAASIPGHSAGPAAAIPASGAPPALAPQGPGPSIEELEALQRQAMLARPAPHYAYDATAYGP